MYNFVVGSIRRGAQIAKGDRSGGGFMSQRGGNQIRPPGGEGVWAGQGGLIGISPHAFGNELFF